MKTKRQISLKRSFQVIQGVVALLLAFLAIQSCILWFVCVSGVRATRGLEKEGLPSLRLMASLDEDLAIYRLHSFELMFAQDKDRQAKITETDAVMNKIVQSLKALDELYPDGEGRQRINALQSVFDGYVKTMTQIRGQLEKDFPTAMKTLDQDVPKQVKQLEQAAASVTSYCRDVANQRVGLTVQNFSRIRYSVVGFGAANIAFAILAVSLVTRNSRRACGAITELADSLKQVSTSLVGSAKVLSGSSQSLADSSSHQAASLEETSSSLEEMSSMTKRNAENAHRANDLAKEARQAADRGVLDMQTMNTAMEAIKVSGNDIAKIIKTIDEIAFQTNLLALNAAVEAARAGEAGMGFAVVADEVRNLAQRSAQAARETTAKIEAAINNTAQGVQISRQVSQTLGEIVSKARQVDELAAEVSSASREQTEGISQINAAVGQMDRVTQTNAANAEESAAAVEELNAQAGVMKKSVAELLKLVGAENSAETSGDSRKEEKSMEAAHQKTRPAETNGHASGNGNGNGSAPGNGNGGENDHFFDVSPKRGHGSPSSPTNPKSFEVR